MCMDFLKVGEQLEVLNHNFDGLHFDIMDGHFCKNLSLSPAFLRAIRKKTDLPVDVHIMATEPGDFIEEIGRAGATSISVHAETINTDAFRTFRKIKELGCKVGLVLNPATTLEENRYLLGEVDLLTIMTVDIGFAGQKFILEMLDKIRTAKQMRESKGYHYLIQIDGGCRADYYRQLYLAGADAYIVGNAGLFSLDENLQKASDKMHRQFAEAIYGEK